MNLLDTYRQARSKGAHVLRRSDARGGFATPAAPGLLPPGYTDPRVRAFTRSVLDPKWESDPKWQALPSGEKENLIYRIPPPEDLDRLALFAPPPPGWSAFSWLDTTPDGPLPDGTYREPTWKDVERAGTAIGRPDLDAFAVRNTLGWWRQAVALGPLPEDDEYLETETREPSYNWPKGGSNRTRKIYFWGFGKDGKLYQHMQLQKQNSFDGWQIFNQFAQNLTYVKDPASGKWIAGWDFGDWFTQNKVTVIAGIQIAFQAIVTVLSLGTAAPGTALATAATVGAVFAANQALGAAMTGIATGDWGKALESIYKMASDLASVPEVKAALAENKTLESFVKSEPIQTIGKITAGMKWPPTIEEMVKRAAVMAKEIPISPDLLKDARAQVPDYQKIWFDVAFQKGKEAVADRVAGLIPWYAQGTWDYAATLGAYVDAKTYFGNVVKSGAYEKQMTVAQTLAMLKQSVSQSTATSWRQVLNQNAGIKAPKFLPAKDSRSPKPESEQGGLGGAFLLVLLAVAAFFFFR